MTDNLVARRIVQAGALLLIGNGIMGLIRPRWHSLLFAGGPQLLRAATEELADHPKTARAVYLAEAAVGLAIVAKTSDE
jgi:hypothetical protein